MKKFIEILYKNKEQIGIAVVSIISAIAMLFGIVGCAVGDSAIKATVDPLARVLQQICVDGVCTELLCNKVDCIKAI